MKSIELCQFTAAEDMAHKVFSDTNYMEDAMQNDGPFLQALYM